ncbi:MAG: hypothetical protein AABX50_01540 [Nanoarchaeota archaeon]
MAKKIRGKRKEAAKTTPLKNKIQVSWRNFLIFLVLFIVSFVLYLLSSTPVFLNLFGLLSIIFGFLSLALFIVLMVFLILKSGKK